MNLNELKKQSLSDENFISQIVYKIKNPDTRSDFFKVISSIGSHWQENPTPLDIIRKMVGKTSLDNKKILVLFNIEFLQVLIEEKNIKPENIYYVADNKLEYLCGSKIFKVQSYHLKQHNVASLKQQITGLNMKFDLVFSNPPYNGNVDIKILNEIVDVADEFIVVHPSTWVIDIKNRNPTFEKFKNTSKSIIQSVDLFNGNDIFGIQLEVPCAIIHYNHKFKSNKITLNHENKTTLVTNSEDITKFGSDWLEIIKPFYENLVIYNQNHTNLWNMRVLDINLYEDDKIYCQLTSMMNGFTKGSSKLADKFYSLTMKNYEGNYGLRNTSPLRVGKVEPAVPTFEFKNSNEAYNFLKYCQTDFVRFCLAIYKNSANIIYGEIDLIPWLDFSEEWDDEKLFKKFNVSQELQVYIRDFLPDYHGIRK